jgi:hypothetical protein
MKVDKKRILQVVLICVFIALLLLLFDVARIDAGSLTLTRIIRIAGKVENHYSQKGKIPESLDYIDSLNKKDFEDGWGRRFDYAINADGAVTIKSPGRDGKYDVDDHYTMTFDPKIKNDWVHNIPRKNN